MIITLWERWFTYTLHCYLWLIFDVRLILSEQWLCSALHTSTHSSRSWSPRLWAHRLRQILIFAVWLDRQNSSLESLPLPEIVYPDDRVPNVDVMDKFPVFASSLRSVFRFVHLHWLLFGPCISSGILCTTFHKYSLGLDSWLLFLVRISCNLFFRKIRFWKGRFFGFLSWCFYLPSRSLLI